MEEEMLKKYLEIKAKIKELKKEQANFKTKILTEMKLIDKDNYISEDGVEVNIKRYTRKSIDKEKLETFCEETSQDLDYFYKELEIEQLDVV